MFSGSSCGGRESACCCPASGSSDGAAEMACRKISTERAGQELNSPDPIRLIDAGKETVFRLSQP